MKAKLPLLLLLGAVLMGGGLWAYQSSTAKAELRAELAQKQAEYDGALKARTWMLRAAKKAKQGDGKAAKEMLLRAAEVANTQQKIDIARIFMRGDMGQTIDRETTANVASTLPDEDKFQLYAEIGASYAHLRNREKALEYLVPAADGGNTHAMRTLAKSYANYEGRYDPDAIDKANLLYDLAASKGDPWAEMGKARQTLRLLHDEEAKLGIAPMLELAKDPQFHDDAHRELAHYFEKDDYKPADYSKAYEHYSAIKKPLPATKANLAKYYATGAGGAKDLAKARELLETLTEQGSYPDTALLGHLYRLGLGVPKEPQKAYEIYAKTKIGDSNPNGHFIGYMYQVGELPPPSGVSAPDAAIAAYQRGINARVDTAYVLMARAYETGYGVPNDEVKALELMEYAAQGGSNLGRAAMADYLRLGIGREPHLEMSENWANLVRESSDVLIFECDVCDPKTD